MSELRIKYQLNCKKSKALCLKLEKLLEDADYYEKALLSDSLERAVYNIQSLRDELDKLWYDQVDLYFKVMEEYEDIQYNNKLKMWEVGKQRNNVMSQYRPVNTKYHVLKNVPHFIEGK